MNHSFNTDLAELYGIEEAILIENIAFWTRKNIANNSNLHDGKYWVFNSARAFEELFPYMNKTKIHRVLKHLVDEGVLVSGMYNKNKYDRTKWYSIIGEKAVTIYKLPFCNMNYGSVQSELTIPSIDTTIITTIEKTLVQLDKLDESFEIFWLQYNKKKAKKKCLAKWKLLKVSDRNKIMEVLGSYLKMESNIQYRPHPLTFLNGELWNDEITIKEPYNNRPVDNRRREREVLEVINGKPIYK